MTNDSIFSLANFGAMAGWLLLALAPLRRGPIILAARAVGGVLAVLYTGFILAALTGGAPMDFTKLSGLAASFSNPSVMLVGWIHYLAFDLWVGAWEAEVAPRWGVPHWALLPCLVLTFMFGPMGLLAFLIVAGVFRLTRKA
jgi:Domain of unknown function (DUF4281)